MLVSWVFKGSKKFEFFFFSDRTGISIVVVLESSLYFFLERLLIFLEGLDVLLISLSMVGLYESILSRFSTGLMINEFLTFFMFSSFSYYYYNYGCHSLAIKLHNLSTLVTFLRKWFLPFITNWMSNWITSVMEEWSQLFFHFVVVIHGCNNLKAIITPLVQFLSLKSLFVFIR